MYKKFVVTSALLLAYLLACWWVDVISSKIVMDASGRSFTIANHYFYNEYIFIGDNTERNLKVDRIFLLCSGVGYFVYSLAKRNRKTK
ncbi:hypothetical protein MU1_11040 [Paenibacillus glycanilyticus]|uniref:DUF4306 domain-containing protein n=1 Tax=Paenibacillus glycanilyticus TaxID=126569 RepID=A0ABQ6G9N2_9BACL|nr:hypothetical protein MU1_11040 [Paenibacillus glycanilyticus]